MKKSITTKVFGAKDRHVFFARLPEHFNVPKFQKKHGLGTTYLIDYGDHWAMLCPDALPQGKAEKVYKAIGDKDWAKHGQKMIRTSQVLSKGKAAKPKPILVFPHVTHSKTPVSEQHYHMLCKMSQAKGMRQVLDDEALTRSFCGGKAVDDKGQARTILTVTR